MMRKVREVYWWLRVVLLALKWVPRFNLGDRVLYHGRICVLYQGVNSPMWKITNPMGNSEIHESEFRKVRTVTNYIGSFRSGYRFYMQNWYAIWVSKGIEPWMRGLKIW